MAIYSRFGGKVTPVRLATVADVKAYENRKPDKQDRDRTSEGWRAIFKYEDTGKEFLADAAYLRADEGFAEIANAFRAMGSDV